MRKLIKGIMHLKNKNLVIAIDGYASSGKSTIAKALSKKLNFKYIDSGAMYRIVTLYAMRKNYINGKEINIEKLQSDLNKIEIDFKYNNEGNQDSYLNGENVEKEIRNLEVSEKVSYISELSFVRKRLVQLQQQMGKQKRIVMDGRDIGTTVFPNADIKLYVTASSEIRAKRRYDELIAKGENVSFDEILENVKKRDFIDKNREISPLKKADDAFTIDTSQMHRETQLKHVMNLIINKFGKS